MITARALVSMLLTMALAACVTVGTKFDVAKVDQLTPGVSTMGEATTLLGPAQSESTLNDNSKLLQWQYAQGALVGGSGAHLAILFDPAGKMVRVAHKGVIRYR